MRFRPSWSGRPAGRKRGAHFPGRRRFAWRKRSAKRPATCAPHARRNRLNPRRARVSQRNPDGIPGEGSLHRCLTARILATTTPTPPARPPSPRDSPGPSRPLTGSHRGRRRRYKPEGFGSPPPSHSPAWTIRRESRRDSVLQPRSSRRKEAQAPSLHGVTTTSAPNKSVPSHVGCYGGGASLRGFCQTCSPLMNRDLMGRRSGTASSEELSPRSARPPFPRATLPPGPSGPNPNGILSSSPGSRGTSHPGFPVRIAPYPNGVASPGRAQSFPAPLQPQSRNWNTASQGNRPMPGFVISGIQPPPPRRGPLRHRPGSRSESADCASGGRCPRRSAQRPFAFIRGCPEQSRWAF